MPGIMKGKGYSKGGGSVKKVSMQGRSKSVPGLKVGQAKPTSQPKMKAEYSARTNYKKVKGSSDRND